MDSHNVIVTTADGELFWEVIERCHEKAFNKIRDHVKQKFDGKDWPLWVFIEWTIVTPAAHYQMHIVNNGNSVMMDMSVTVKNLVEKTVTTY